MQKYAFSSYPAKKCFQSQLTQAVILEDLVGASARKCGPRDYFHCSDSKVAHILGGDDSSQADIW